MTLIVHPTGADVDERWDDEPPPPGRARRAARFVKWYPVIPGLLLALILGGALLAPLIATHGPNEQLLGDRFRPPFWLDGGTWNHPLGTDALGRDVFARALHGARTSMLVAAVSIVIGTTAGTLVALVAGNWRDTWVDGLLMRIADAALSLPLILIALLFAVIVGPSFGSLVTIIALFVWARTARIVRGEVLNVASRDYVTWARITGASNVRVIFRHLLPNIAHLAIVIATLEVGGVILLEASLSFLGVGVPPPAPTWGGMVAEGREYISIAWWLLAVPGLMIMTTVISLNFLGDWLRDRLDPRHQHGA